MNSVSSGSIHHVAAAAAAVRTFRYEFIRGASRIREWQRKCIPSGQRVSGNPPVPLSFPRNLYDTRCKSSYRIQYISPSHKAEGRDEINRRNKPRVYGKSRSYRRANEFSCSHSIRAREGKVTRDCCRRCCYSKNEFRWESARVSRASAQAFRVVRRADDDRHEPERTYVGSVRIYIRNECCSRGFLFIGIFPLLRARSF